MTPRTIIPLTALTLVLGGCQHSAAASSPQDPMPQTPAPFASPPVLPVTTVQEVRTPHSGFNAPDMPDIFKFFPHGPGGIQRFGGGEGNGDEVMKQQALGSGFLVDPQGHVVTNAHVIDGANVVKVKLADDREFRAKVVGKDDRLDIAVLELESAPHDLPSASLGQSEATRVGEYVVAIGNPFGLGNTVTMGIVSAKGRTIGAGPYDDFIQTDASINPGNSGGPLFNLRGQVVGINTAINPNGKGIGFAIPIDAVKQVLPQLLATGHVQRGRLGVVIQPMDADLAKALGLDRTHGALVEDVESGSPAETAGIKPGDVVMSVDGQGVPHSEDLPRMVAGHAPGAQVHLAIWHDRKQRDLTVALAALETKETTGDVQQPSGAADPGAKASTLGIGVTDVEGHVVVARVVPDGPADGKLRRGDVIEEIDQQPVSGAADLAAKVKAGGGASKPLLLRVRRGDQSRYVAIERTGN
jgi:serine protease Do